MISMSIKAFFDMMKELFKFKEEDFKTKPTREIVNEKKSLKKASDYTEMLLDITDKYIEHFDKKDLKRYNSLKRKFKKHN